jgi:SAM-dependent methyltransferase
MKRVTRGAGLLEGVLARQRMRLADRLIPASHRPGRVLDVGCGNYPLFLKNTRFREKFGVDRLPYAPEWCSPDLRGIHLVSHDVEERGELPFASDFFEAVTMLAVLEHLDPGKVVRITGEVHRVLARGGIFVMTTPARWTDKLLRIMAGMRLVSREEIDEHKDVYDHPRIVEILRSAGFPEGSMRFGYFEIYANLWVAAVK